MRFIKQVSLIGGLGVLLLVNCFSVGLAKATEKSDKAKLGGVPALCYQQRLKAISDPDKQFQAFDRLFNRYQTTNQDRLILQLLKSMDKKQFPHLQASALIQVASHYDKATESPKALLLLSQALELLQPLDQDLESPSINLPYLDKYQLLADLGIAFMYLNQPDRAETAILQSLQAMQKNPRLSATAQIDYMVRIASVLIVLGKQEQAIAILDQSLKAIQSLKDRGNWSNLRMLSHLSWQYRVAGQASKADLLFTQSLQYATSFSNPVAKVSGLSAIAEMTYLPPDPYDVSQFPFVTKLSQRNERQAKLKQIFAKILQIMQSNHTVEMSQFVNIATAQWLQFLGVEPAMQIANTVADPVERFKVLTPILRSIRPDNGLKDIDLLLPLLNEAEKIARTIPSTVDRDEAWNIIAATYAMFGQSSTALQAIAQIQDAKQKQIALIQVADNLARANQPDLALSLVKSLPNDAVQQVQYDALRAYLKTGKLELALGLQRKLSPDFQKYSLPEIAETSAELGHTTQALMLLRQVPEPQWRSLTFSSIIQKALEVGNLDQAVVFAQQMPPSSDSYIPSKSWFQEEIAIAYAESSQYEKALQLAQMLPDRSLSQLVNCAKQQGLVQNPK